jgi:hypothetical protein
MLRTERWSLLSAPTVITALVVLENRFNARLVHTLRHTWKASSLSTSVQIARPDITVTMAPLIDQRSAMPVSIVFQVPPRPMSRVESAQPASTALKEPSSQQPALMGSILFLGPRPNLTAPTVAQATTVSGI